MAISKIVQNSIDETSVSLGAKISNVQIANSSYTVLDDTAVNVGGGYIVITGSGFKESAQVLIGQNTACSVSVVDSTTIRAQVPAKDAGTYPIYVVNTDGGVGIRVPGLTYSGYPTWVTGSTLPDQGVDEEISIQLQATGANTYALQTGSTLPTGMVLNTANGLLSGTVTGVTEETLYNFTIEAIDTENQESPRAFNVTLVLADPYFKQSILLLDGNGTSGANNNIFRDSSDNNYTVTKAGNNVSTQGTFSPFSQPSGKWSVDFPNGANKYLSLAASSAFNFGSGAFTIEGWYYHNKKTDSDTTRRYLIHTEDSTWDGTKWIIYAGYTGNENKFLFYTYADFNANSNTPLLVGNTTLQVGNWYHFAITRSGNTFRLFVNGVLEASSTRFTGNVGADSYTVYVGGGSTQTDRMLAGALSNLRVVKGRAVYTSAFTPPDTSLGLTSGGEDPPQGSETVLLMAAQNRFVDATGKTISVSGSPTVSPFSPFAPTTEYDPAVNGGSSCYASLLTNPAATTVLGTNTWTMGAWVFLTPSLQGAYLVATAYQVGSNNLTVWGVGDGSNKRMTLQIYQGGSNQVLYYGVNDSLTYNEWNYVALVHSGSGTYRYYINGVAQTPTSATGKYWNTAVASSTSTTIGYTNYNSGTGQFNGHLCDLRIKSGIDTTVPTGPVTSDPDAYLLLNFTNAGIIDYTAKNSIGTEGNVSVNTAVSKYGTGSIRINTPIGPKLTIPPSPTTSFGTEDFTIECWYYPITKPDVAPTIITNDNTGSYPGNYWALHDRHNTDGYSGTKFSFWVGNAVANQLPVLASNTSVTNNNWYHLAVTRSGNTMRLFVNGNLEASNTSVSASLDGGTSRSMFIGRSGYSDSGLNGLIDELRITKGVARYTETFNPPTTHRKR